MRSTPRSAFSRPFIALIALTLSAAVAPFGAAPALAHAHLQAASPADKASITTSPEAITLTFSEALSLALSGITLTAEGKGAVTTGAARLGPDGKSLTVPLTAPLAPGAYQVDWHVLSVDGHKTRGTLHFTVAP
ncbi:hypothetical protein BTR14_07000 [Rhizobium rhizosphaerae]|uniref:CopC domain-containing protein n=1 Tax=Xaviernesmea rhizosphaerae TaxID=1672749 RepID=A0ABX3PGA6_9HYPH|nr:copper homeostasis periplasmic binding protein CopC [Xaviernesmea rhizosphaerae]OQP87166.1 hypothetical protein BTR14_07000 [Xaviernesmea rhizosphaerae]